MASRLRMWMRPCFMTRIINASLHLTHSSMHCGHRGKTVILSIMESHKITRIARNRDTKGAGIMEFHVTYRLMHPNYLPATKVAIVSAEAHSELDSELAHLKAKWEARGYVVRILRTVASSRLEPRKKTAFLRRKG